MYAEAGGRAALAQGAWPVARARFEAALEAAVTPDALEGLSWATWWLEDAPACLDAREQAYRLYRQAGDLRGAARMALWLGDDHNEFYGAGAVAEGWFNGAARLLDDLEPCPELGWLRVFDAHAALGRHDTERARELAGEARALGLGHRAVDLEMFSLATEGLALVEDGAVEQGMRCLDEATAGALGGEYENLAPAAWTCCRLISACEEIRDCTRWSPTRSPGYFGRAAGSGCAPGRRKGRSASSSGWSAGMPHLLRSLSIRQWHGATRTTSGEFVRRHRDRARVQP